MTVSASGGGTQGWRAAGATDTGRVRAHNEDCFYCDADEGLFVVIDGVGGHQAGEVAAAIAVDLVVRRLKRRTGSAEERLREAIALANNEIYRQAEATPERAGMACVLTAAVLEGDQLTVGHVGDTRLYLAREGGIFKVTRDHSPVGMQEDAGKLTEREAMQHPRRNEIYRDVGTDLRDPYDEAFVEIIDVFCGPESALLLCSDGLTDLVGSDALRQVLEAHVGKPDAAVQALIDAANTAGGKDNVTVIVGYGDRYGEVAGEVASEEGTPARRASDASDAGSRGARRWRTPLAFALGLLAGIVLLTLVQSMLPEQLEPAAAGRTFDVAADSTAPFVTVAEALAAARQGDRVVLAPGVYTEDLVVGPGVALVGTPGSVLRPRTDSAAALRLQGESRVERLVLEGAGAGVGVSVMRGRTAFVDEVEVRGFGTGIVADSGASVVIRASRLERNGRGLVLAPTAAARLVHSFVLDTGARGDTLGTGVVVPEGAEVVLEGNVFGRNVGGALYVTPASRTASLRQRNVFLEPR